MHNIVVPCSHLLNLFLEDFAKFQDFSSCQLNRRNVEHFLRIPNSGKKIAESSDPLKIMFLVASA